VVLSGGIVIGPGRADLLEGIRDRGSIAAAGRAMAMSYKRAWSLVEEMQQAFGAALVEAAPGGATGGGARLTKLGANVLETYRRMQLLADEAARPEIDRLERLIHSGG
jgi:molybdate transport system regulatory protein